ncbi:amyloid fiber anchoring/assembly protein TapA [Sutcliffiella cohnii]|uniref:amyloid fiber anchoring/assembly protein TapA n=1 Tax=Sutcliffiella cohnii TaxID=33932 RepID=UPI002E237132|nr:amyloid fiber anchoring/assembly protein TapA [Sutcliffiella cohnii]
MRSSRLRKYGKKHKAFLIVLQMALIYYALIISFSYLTNGTLAYFSDTSKTNATISTASDWYDGSHLIFPNRGTQVVHSCPPVDIAVEVKNEGLSMSKPTEYEIYYTELKENGNPRKHGDIIASGWIEPIPEGGSILLTFKAEKVGWYVFKALQRPGFEKDYINRKEVWSEKVKVQCKKQKDIKGATEEENEIDKSIEEKEEIVEEQPNEDIKNEEEVNKEEKMDEEELELEPEKEEKSEEIPPKESDDEKTEEETSSEQPKDQSIDEEKEPEGEESSEG